MEKQMMNGVQIVNIVRLLGELFGEAAFKWNGPSYKETSKAVREWVKENNAHYYAKPREDFFVPEAVREARAAGKKIVVVEDLS